MLKYWNTQKPFIFHLGNGKLIILGVSVVSISGYLENIFKTSLDLELSQMFFRLAVKVSHRSKEVWWPPLAMTRLSALLMQVFSISFCLKFWTGFYKQTMKTQIRGAFDLPELESGFKIMILIHRFI